MFKNLMYNKSDKLCINYSKYYCFFNEIF